MKKIKFIGIILVVCLGFIACNDDVIETTEKEFIEIIDIPIIRVDVDTQIPEELSLRSINNQLENSCPHNYHDIPYACAMDTLNRKIYVCISSGVPTTNMQYIQVKVNLEKIIEIRVTQGIVHEWVCIGSLSDFSPGYFYIDVRQLPEYASFYDPLTRETTIRYYGPGTNWYGSFGFTLMYDAGGEYDGGYYGDCGMIEFKARQKSTNFNVYPVVEYVIDVEGRGSYSGGFGVSMYGNSGSSETISVGNHASLRYEIRYQVSYPGTTIPSKGYVYKSGSISAKQKIVIDIGEC